MKRWQSASVVAAVALVVVFASRPALNLRAQPRLTQAQAATLQPTPPSLVPGWGTFWSVSRPENPPLPFNPYPDLPVYRLPDGSWLFDDSTVQFPSPPPTNVVAAARNSLLQSTLASERQLLSLLENQGMFLNESESTNSPPEEDPCPPQLMDTNSVPEFGTFWFMTRTNDPPLPFDPCTGCDVYLLCNGSYLVDDTGYTWPQPSGGDGGGTEQTNQYIYVSGDFWLEITGVTNDLANLILHGTTSGVPYTILSRRTLSSDDPWDAEAPLAGATGQDWTPVQIPTFGRPVLFFQAMVGYVTPQRLWLCAVGISNDWFNCVLHGTTEGVNYELLSVSSLAQVNNWASETNVPGASGQFWTPVSIPLSGRSNPNLFLWARSWVSSNGSGIPDWWLLQYFASTDIDPYALCPSGDGWTILQAYQNGWNPYDWQTPPPPQNVMAVLDSTGTNATITWVPGGGPVTNYAIWFGGWVGQVDPNTFSFTYQSTLPSNRFIPDWAFTVRAYFANGSYADSQPASVTAARLSSTIAAVRGPAGQFYLAVGSVPPDLSSVRVYWKEWDASEGARVYRSMDLDASTFVNGVAALPVDQMTGYEMSLLFWAQCITTNGSRGAVATLWPYPGNSSEKDALSGAGAWSLVDARHHLKENLKFLLGSATVTLPFSYASSLGTDGYDYGEANPAGIWSPEDYYARPPSPSSYEYYGFHFFSASLNYSVMQELRSAQENYLWRNFVYDSGDFDTSGNWTNGVDYDPYFPGLRLLAYPKYQFSCTNCDPPPLALSITSHPYLYTRWIPYDTAQQFADDLAETGLGVSGTNIYLPTGVRNAYGLPLDSVLFNTASPLRRSTLNAGGASAEGLDGADYYCAVAAPALQTVDYYFASQTPYLNGEYNFWPGYGPLDGPAPPLPGSPTFSETNTSPLLITGIGQPITVSGWARMAITNGYPDRYAYLEQYFTNAFTIDASGNVTTNSAGLLSPYGEFFPMQPGLAALITMPDIDTGQQGTGVVNVIKLQTDVDHNGKMDLSFGGPDNTSQARPYVHWINNNFDRFTLDDSDLVDYDDDVSSTSADAKNLFTGKFTPDYDYTDAAGTRIISCTRDLQDFARLWVCGITTNLLTNLPPGTTISLSWGDVGNPNPVNPTIDLFKAADPDGGIGYLTSSTTAFVQTLASSYPCIGRLGPGSNLVLNASQLNGWAGNYFIWCGVSNGTGALTLTISQGGTNTLAQTTAYIQLVDIKQMYERWTIGDTPSIPAYTNAIAAPDGLPLGISKFEYGASTDTNTPYILFVHGWNMEPWEKDRFAESAFKRLYWQGYQGRFGSFRWPTENRFKGTWTQLLTNPGQKDNFDRSEYTAWKSGAALLNKLNDLNREYPGHVYLLAHSMGNIVAGEALRLAGANRVVNTYVASQAALSAHTYDTNIPNYSFTYGPSGFGPWTPNIYVNWLATNAGAGAGQIISFYNTNDYALQRSVWQLNQILKPDQYVPLGGSTWSYGYGGFATDPPPWTNFHKDYSYGLSRVNFDIYNVLTNRYEVMALDAQSWTTALGATPGVLNVNRNIQLTRTSPTRIWPADSTGNNYAQHFWHSAEFRGDYWQMQGYWSELLGAEAFKLK